MANEKKNKTEELQAAIQSLVAKGKKEGMIRAGEGCLKAQRSELMEMLLMTRRSCG